MKRKAKKARPRAAGKRRTRGAGKAGSVASKAAFKLGGCMFNAPQQSLKINIKKK
jgi:hypothetical protein